MNREQAATIMAMLAKAFGKDPDEGTAEMWFQSGLADVDPDVGLEAATSLVRSADWMPSVAEFRREVLLVRRRRGELRPGPGTGPMAPRDEPADPRQLDRETGPRRSQAEINRAGVARVRAILNGEDD